MAEIVARGLRFHYQRLGQGNERVVFIHGFIWDNLSSWYFTVASAVARDADVLLYDLRGHGKSERPRSGYSMQDMIADLDAILEGTGFGDRPLHLVGNSFGGLLALGYAIAHPERVATLVLVDAHIADSTWANEMRETLQSQGEERDRKIIQSFREWAGRHGDPRNTRLAKAAQELVQDTDLLGELVQPYIFSEQQLRQVGCPILAIYGEHSDLRHKGEWLQQQLPDCTLEMVAEGSHVILWEAAAMLRDRIISWLREHCGSVEPGRR